MPGDGRRYVEGGLKGETQGKMLEGDGTEDVEGGVEREKGGNCRQGDGTGLQGLFFC